LIVWLLHFSLLPAISGFIINFPGYQYLRYYQWKVSLLDFK